jgi:hypothetical protein
MARKNPSSGLAEAVENRQVHTMRDFSTRESRETPTLRCER